MGLDTFRGTATARLELRRSKVGRGPRGRHLPTQGRRCRFTLAQSKCALNEVRTPARRAGSRIYEKRRACFACTATRHLCASDGPPSAPLNFFSLPEPRAEGSEELGRRLGGVTHGTPMGPRNAPHAVSGPSRRAIFE